MSHPSWTGGVGPSSTSRLSSPSGEKTIFIRKIQPTTEPVKTHYSSAKVKAFLEKAGQSAIKLKNLPLCFLNFRISIRIKVDGCGVVTIAHAFI